MVPSAISQCVRPRSPRPWGGKQPLPLHHPSSFCDGTTWKQIDVRVLYRVTNAFVAAAESSSNLCCFFMADVYFLYGKRVQAARSCPCSPAALSRHPPKSLQHIWDQEKPELQACKDEPWESLRATSQSGEHVACCPAGSISRTMGNVHFTYWSESAVQEDIPP